MRWPADATRSMKIMMIFEKARENAKAMEDMGRRAIEESRKLDAPAVGQC